MNENYIDTEGQTLFTNFTINNNYNGEDNKKYLNSIGPLTILLLYNADVLSYKATYRRSQRGLWGLGPNRGV